jgi:hypothetical protein
LYFLSLSAFYTHILAMVILKCRLYVREPQDTYAVLTPFPPWLYLRVDGKE